MNTNSIYTIELKKERSLLKVSVNTPELCKLRNSFNLDVELEVKAIDHDIFNLHRIKLLSHFENNSICFQDLYGNGYGTLVHRKGFGTLLVNTAIEFYNQIIPKDSKVKVYGKVSSVDDKTEKYNLRELLLEKRIHFWGKFGFDFYCEDTAIKADLSNLRLCMENQVLDGLFPNYIIFSDFTLNKHYNN